jgi:hypothetical protein
MSNLDLGKETFSNPSVINDPFNFHKIDSIIIHSRVGWMGDEWIHTATVTFKNGKTEGSQRFNGKNLDEVIILVRNFVKELHNNVTP